MELHFISRIFMGVGLLLSLSSCDGSAPFMEESGRFVRSLELGMSQERIHEIFVLGRPAGAETEPYRGPRPFDLEKYRRYCEHQRLCKELEPLAASAAKTLWVEDFFVFDAIGRRKLFVSVIYDERFNLVAVIDYPRRRARQLE